MQTISTMKQDVVSIGGGLGGLAASIFLGQMGLKVVCIEPEPFPRARVGESLDWSTPGLLQALGLPRDQLITEGIATYKHNIQIVTLEGTTWIAQPEEWFRKKPIEFETKTLHVDRNELDQRLFEKAKKLGVKFIWDRISTVETKDNQVVACNTAGNQRLSSTWFIDCSGRSRLFAKTFGIKKVDYGRQKACLWTYIKTKPHNQGTTFYVDAADDEYLSWIWEIPITPNVASIGFIMPANKLKEQRKNSKHINQILLEELSKYPYFKKLMAKQPDLKVLTCSYHSYVNQYACDQNWFMVGESASFPDPFTANGATAAFRHAKEASAFIQESLERGLLSKRQKHVYNTNVCRMGHAFNHSIEKVIYGWRVRRGLGIWVAQKVYTAFSYPINALYSKYQPKGRLSMIIFGLTLKGVWIWMETWALLGGLTFYVRGLLHGRFNYIKYSQKN